MARSPQEKTRRVGPRASARKGAAVLAFTLQGCMTAVSTWLELLILPSRLITNHVHAELSARSTSDSRLWSKVADPLPVLLATGGRPG